jgi:hypothetical protein
MLVTDRAVQPYFESVGATSMTLVELAGAVGVVLVGRWLAGRRKGAAAASPGASR